jgi:hypothetical protein
LSLSVNLSGIFKDNLAANRNPHAFLLKTNEVVADDFHDIFGYENVIVVSLVDDADGLK